MRVERSSYNSQQSFGILHIEDPRARKLLFPRMLTGRNKWENLAKIQKAHSKNPVVVDLMATSDGNRLLACIYGGAKSEYMEESFLASVFCSPLRFIKKACKRADEINKMIQN